ncbi:MAG: hypothetical protein U0M69_05235 [Lachnospiraceae bacterium]|nr:hypothetical protein [Lachnospiraceae bacterium]
MKKKIHFSKIYMIGLLLTFLLFLFTGRQVYTHITLNYVFDPSGDAITSVYCGEELLAEAEVIDGQADLYFWGSEFTSIAPIHYDTYEELYLESIEIRVHGRQVCKMLPEQILENFTPNEGILSLQAEEQGVSITTKNDSPALMLAEPLMRQISDVAGFMSILNLLFYIVLWTFIYWYLFKVLDIKNDRSYLNLLDVVLGIAGITAILLSWNIAFTSAYGGTVHPDEMQTRAAVEYYRAHWIQPDVRSEFVAGTVSGYGMTRLSEINLYYLFAGKFANLCGFPMAFRALGMLMILILGCLVLRNIKKERYMVILFFATPQLWYLFSYATSDAYDYLFTVIAAYEVLSGNSALNRILKEPFKKRHIPAYLGMGFVFANLLMAKKTFYLVLATIFMLLLYRLIFAEKNERKQMFVKYLCLLGTAFAIVLVRYLPDLGYYGLNKGAAVDQVIEATAWPEYKPSTPAIEQAKSTLLFEKGVTLKEFFVDWNFNEELFKNYFGYYGIYSLEAKGWYYVLMSALYIALFSVVGILVHQNIKRKKATGESVIRVRLTYWTMWAMIALMYLLTIYNAYFVDFQPQGRYLFPALPALACQIGLYKEVEEHKAVRTLLTAIAVVSLYSFYKIAYLNF